MSQKERTMYLGKQIWRRINDHIGWAKGTVSASIVEREVQNIIRPFGAKVKIKQIKFTNKKTWFMVGGEFAPDVYRQPITIEIFLNSQKGYIYFTQKRRERFIFLLAQTLQHELVHKLQFKNRGDERFYTEHSYFTPGNSKSSPKTLDYLSMIDEIDAHAHDLAMEIKYHYPLDDPIKILRRVSEYPDLPTWKIYNRAFRGARWAQVRNELLRKTYKWLPTVKEPFISG